MTRQEAEQYLVSQGYDPYTVSKLSDENLSIEIARQGQNPNYTTSQQRQQQQQTETSPLRTAQTLATNYATRRAGNYALGQARDYILGSSAGAGAASSGTGLASGASVLNGTAGAELAGTSAGAGAASSGAASAGAASAEGAGSSAGMLGSAAPYLGALAAAGGAYGLGSQLDSGHKSTKNGAMSGMAMGAGIGSIIPGVGTLAGAAIGALAGAALGQVGHSNKYFQGKDRKDMLYSLSTALNGQPDAQGEVNKNVTLANGQMFDLGNEGYKDPSLYNIDWDDKNVTDNVWMVDPLGEIISLNSKNQDSGDTETDRAQMTSVLTNMISSGGDAAANAKDLYTRMGYTKDSIMENINQLEKAGRIDKGRASAYRNSMENLFGGDPYVAKTESEASGGSNVSNASNSANAAVSDTNSSAVLKSNISKAANTASQNGNTWQGILAESSKDQGKRDASKESMGSSNQSDWAQKLTQALATGQGFRQGPLNIDPSKSNVKATADDYIRKQMATKVLKQQLSRIAQARG